MVSIKDLKLIIFASKELKLTIFVAKELILAIFVKKELGNLCQERVETANISIFCHKVVEIDNF